MTQVALFAMMDSANQHFLLAEAMRKYLKWDAKSTVMRESYLGYETDWVLNKETEHEIREFTESADLIIFQDVLFDLGAFDFPKLASRLKKITSPKNTIINCLGSPARNNLRMLVSLMLEGWPVVPPMSDPTIARWLMGVPFENVMIPTERIDNLTAGIKRNDKFTICHAPTKEMKGEDLWVKVADEIPEVDLVVIKGMCWKDAIKEKAKCHMLVDSLGDQSYGVSCLESLYMGQNVLSNISPWCYALHPDLPMETTWKKLTLEIINKIKRMIEMDQPNFEWVLRNFSELRVVEKWSNYIESVMEID